ncbi:hypothetical protein M0804_008961 [Polistes exclamans]|nr:hypothetical protein M0804_008961 [Polistes exclamans]
MIDYFPKCTHYNWTYGIKGQTVSSKGAENQQFLGTIAFNHIRLQIYGFLGKFDFSKGTKNRETLATTG